MTIGIVSGFCDRVLAMYAKRIAESAATTPLSYEPRHPYNQALQRSIPALHQKGETFYTIPGRAARSLEPNPELPFRTGCEYAREKCVTSKSRSRKSHPTISPP